MGGGSIGEEAVIFGIEFDGFGVGLDSFLVVFGGEG